VQLLLYVVALNFADCASSSTEDSPKHISLVSALEEKGFFGGKRISLSFLVHFKPLAELAIAIFWLHI
jgi:hypothetical protein